MNQPRILFPTDFSPNATHAMQYAFYLATVLKAEVHILAVSIMPYIDVNMPADMVEKLINDNLQQTNNKIDNLKKTNENINIALHYAVKQGGVVDSVLAYEKENHIDYIVMGTIGSTNILDNIFGSNTSAVMQNAKCPVIAVPLKAVTDDINTVLYATDLNGDENSVISEVLRYAAAVKATVHVVHAKDEFNLDIEGIENKMNDLEVAFAGNPIHFRWVEGETTIKALENEIEVAKPDIVVVARQERGFFANLLHKSFSKHFVLHSDIPVMVVKKEG